MVNKEYHPPAAEVLEHFAHEVSSELGGVYADPQVERGLADFMKTVAQICANNLNRKSSNDLTPDIQ